MTPPGLLRRNVGATGLDPKAKARQGLSGSTSNSQSPTSNRAYPAVLRDFMGVGPWKLTNTNTSSGLGGASSGTAAQPDPARRRAGPAHGRDPQADERQLDDAVTTLDEGIAVARQLLNDTPTQREYSQVTSR